MFVQADILSFLPGEIVVRRVQENSQTEEFAALELVEFIQNITYME